MSSVQYKMSEPALLRFRVRGITVCGESVAVVGSIKELGLWRLDCMHRLETFPSIYPIWQSESEIMAKPNTQIEFKCVIVNRHNEVIWEPISHNRRLVVDDQETLIETEFGNESMTLVSTGREDYSDHGKGCSDGYQLQELSQVGILYYENITQEMTDHIFSVVEGSTLQLDSSVSVSSYPDWCRSRLGELRGIWYINHSQLLSIPNKFHSHMINVCFDNRVNKVQNFQDLSRCKVVLFQDTRTLKEYGRFMSMQEYHVWHDRGCIMVMNSFGLQMATISTFKVEDMYQNSFNTQALFNEFQRITTLLRFCHQSMVQRVRFETVDQLRPPALIIYSDPNVLQLSQFNRNRILALAKRCQDLVVMVNALHPEIQKSFKGMYDQLCILSLVDLSLKEGNSMFSLIELNNSELLQLKERFLAEHTFQLVSNTSFKVELQSKSPRIFEASRPFYEEQLQRFGKVRHRVQECVIKMSVLDMGGIVRSLLRRGEWAQVVLVGSNCLLDELDRGEFCKVDIKRVVDISAFDKLGQI